MKFQKDSVRELTDNHRKNYATYNKSNIFNTGEPVWLIYNIGKSNSRENKKRHS